MFDAPSATTSQFDKGQIVTNTRTGDTGTIVAVFYNEFSGQFVLTVRVPNMPTTVLWNELAVVASQSIDAVSSGDMVIAADNDGAHVMGQVIGLRSGKLIVRMADGHYLVGMSRVWRVMPVSLVRTAATRAA